MADNHDKIMYELGEIKGLLKGIDDHLGNLNGSVAEHQKTINDLTGWKNNMMGKISVVALILGAVGSVLAGVIKSYFP